MTSAIDPSKPTAINPRTSDVRANFAAAQAEIEALQSNSWSSKTVSADTVLPSDTEVTTGRDLRVLADVALSIPYDSLLVVRNYAAGAFL